LIIKNNFSKLIVYALPGLIGSVLSIFTAVIFINYLSSEKYANFLLQHLVITFGSSVLGLGIGKTTVISINNLNAIKKKAIIYSSLILMSAMCFILSLITYIFLILFIKKIDLFDVTTSVFLGLLFSSIYFNIEDMAKGFSLYKSASAANLFFLNLSVSIPAFLLLIFNTDIVKSNLFNISVSIKVLTTLFLLIIILKTQKIKKAKITIHHFFKFRIQNFFLCCYGILNQIYYALDKYIIKSSFNSFQLVTYTLSQQIASKIGIVSYAFSSLMFGKILKKPSNKKKILSANIYFCFYICSFSFLIILPFFNDLLSIILNNKFNPLIAKTLKFFILANIISALKDCLDSFLQTILKLKKDLTYNAIVLPFFLSGIIVSAYLKSLTLFILIILLKEFSLVLLKIQLTKKYLFNYRLFIIQILILSVIVFLNLFYDSKVLYLGFNILFFLIAYINFNGKLIKKYFL
jgi:O-antigen/teichoic acid export membrane protein